MHTGVRRAIYSQLGSLESRQSVSAVRRRLNQWDRRRNLRAAERLPHRIGYHSYDGMPITVVISDPEASAWYDRDWPQVPEVKLLRQGKLRAGSICYIEVHAGCGLEQAAAPSPTCSPASPRIVTAGTSNPKPSVAELGDAPAAPRRRFGLVALERRA